MTLDVDPAYSSSRAASPCCIISILEYASVFGIKELCDIGKEKGSNLLSELCDMCILVRRERGLR